MDRSDVMTLVSVTYHQDAIGQHIPTETCRDIFCRLQSVSAQEFFAAGKEGMKAAFKVTVFAPDYEDEQIAEIGGKRYRIYRTYRKNADELELYMEERAGVR